jgi:predicted nucleotidyltransferase
MYEKKPPPASQELNQERGSWRADLHRFAGDLLKSFAERADVRGVALGGSLARGQEWRRSDVEMAILVEQRLADLDYFAVRAGRGVEIIQLVADVLALQIEQARTDPLAVLDWPIQMYQCQVTHDPTGILTQFKLAFDQALFLPEVIHAKTQRALEAFDREATVAQADLDAGRPLTALAQLRAAFNQLILAFYWRHNILPRSQNRTASLLRAHCRRLDALDFYALYCDVYGFELTAAQARRLLAACRTKVSAIVSGFGPAAADFFYHAVDGEFRWRQTRGILAVYRLYVPLCLRRFQGQTGAFDDPAWRAGHGDLCRFVGLDRPDAAATAELLARAQAFRARLAV